MRTEQSGHLCVELAAAFPSASLLAAVSSRKLSCGNRHPRLGLYSHSFPASTSASQRAGWRKSGSKLHALQSFAPVPGSLAGHPSLLLSLVTDLRLHPERAYSATLAPPRSKLHQSFASYAVRDAYSRASLCIPKLRTRKLAVWSTAHDNNWKCPVAAGPEPRPSKSW